MVSVMTTHAPEGCLSGPSGRSRALRSACKLALPGVALVPVGFLVLIATSGDAHQEEDLWPGTLPALILLLQGILGLGCLRYLLIANRARPSQSGGTLQRLQFGFAALYSGVTLGLAILICLSALASLFS